MKQADGFVPSSCKGDSDYLSPLFEGEYARYLSDYVAAYSSKNIPISYVSLGNEPQNCNTTYPTMEMAPPQEARVATDLRSMLNASGFRDVSILGYDHNWDLSGNGYGTTYPQQEIQAEGVNHSIGLIGYHAYDGLPTSQSAFHSADPDTPVLLTEATGIGAQNSAQDMLYEVGTDLISVFQNWGEGAIYWNLALPTPSPSGYTNPNPGEGCKNCRPMVTISGSNAARSSYSFNEDFYFWEHFSKFVHPGASLVGATKIAGSFRSVAFENTDGSIVLVVLNVPNELGHIVQWAKDTKSQKTAWLVGPDGYRRWISNISTYNCLKTRRAPGPDVTGAGLLDQYPDLTNVWAICGTEQMGVNSTLQAPFYMESTQGTYRFDFQSGTPILYNSSGDPIWSTGVSGSYLILQSDGNLVEYSSPGSPVWASNTAGSGAAYFDVRNDGKLALYNTSNQLVWTNEGPPSAYYGHIVQWAGDTKSQKTAWLVGPDGYRRWISNISTYNCLKTRGAPGPDVLTSWMLNQLPDLTNVWAICGTEQMGVNSTLQAPFYMESTQGTYRFDFQSGTPILYNSSGDPIWSTGVSGSYLILQSDGNLVEYSSPGSPVWASNTAGSGAAYFDVRNDGKLALYNTSNQLVWTN
jgi:glucosylceramidase